MELDAFDFVAAMAKAHDDAVIGFGGDGEFVRQRLSFYNERVITRGGERIGQTAEDVFSVVMDSAGFAVEKFRRANDLPAERRTNGLVTEANSEDGKLPCQAFD